MMYEYCIVHCSGLNSIHQGTESLIKGMGMKLNVLDVDNSVQSHVIFSPRFIILISSWCNLANSVAEERDLLSLFLILLNLDACSKSQKIYDSISMLRILHEAWYHHSFWPVTMCSISSNLPLSREMHSIPLSLSSLVWMSDLCCTQDAQIVWHSLASRA